MSASSSMTRSSRRRRRARRGEPSQSPSVTALPKGEPLASRSWSCWTSEVFCNRERSGSAVSIHGCNTNAAANESRARHLAPHRAQANSRAGPACQCLALRERWQCAALTERASPAAAANESRARHLAPHRAQANSRAGPACQCLALRERWQCAALTERVSPAAASRFPRGALP